MVKDFYSLVLPSRPSYCITTIDRNLSDDNNARNYFADSLNDFYSLLDQKLQSFLDIYVALSSFKTHKRTAAQAEFSRSLFIDLDVGEGKHKYPDQLTALSELLKFIDNEKLPRPVMINSGTGVHAYWIFNTDIEIGVWKEYSQKFKNFCLKNIKIDPVVTADAARIMRCPESLNYKTNPPRPSIFLDLNYKNYIYDFNDFKKLLDNLPEQILKYIPKGLDPHEDTKKIQEANNYNCESVFQIIAQKSLVDRGCEQIKQLLASPATISEPLWRAGLSIAQHCVDRDTSIHLLSEGHPGYDQAKTEAKALGTQGKPQSCVQFEVVNPGGCDKCKHRGKFTNPLALGKVLKEAEKVPVSINATWINGSGFKFPDEIKPFTRGQHGGIYYVPPVEFSDEGAKIQDSPILVSEHDIYPTKRIYNSTDGECLTVVFNTPNDRVREFNIPTRILHTQDELIKLVAERGLTFSPPSRGKYFMDYIIKWSQYLLNKNSADQMRMQMGWTEDNNCFVVGEKEYRRDGSESTTSASPLVYSIAKLLRQQGDYQLWKSAASKLNLPGFEVHAFTMLCGFGSPIMRLTSTAGVSVGLVGPSGYGKTGALYAGLGLFGNPKDLSLVGGKEQATANGLVGWYMGLKNLMLGLDESSNRKADELSDLIHRISQGKGKIRMQSSVNAVRPLEQSASMIGLFTSNQAIYDKLFQLKNNPDGEVARLIEMNLTLPEAMKRNPELGVSIFDTFRQNFGFAGIDYIKQVLKLGDIWVKNLIDQWIVRFTLTKFGRANSYRFYENLIGACFAGGQIAKQAGIIDWDLDRIFNVITKEVLSIKQEVKLNNPDMEGLLGEFQNKYIQSTLYIDNGNVIQEPKLNLVARAEIHNQMYVVSVKEMRKYLADAQVSVREFLNVMRTKGILLLEAKQRLTNGWSGHNNATPISVWGFKYDPSNVVASLPDNV